ncbi:MAG: hypothetical protein SXV54_27605 [Chloroflexota bacterium]|nr:hypothetical protein [Chloroflexota bacterium]
MNSDHLNRYTAVFIVRVWAEYLEQTPPVWRGEIERVSGGEKARFGTLKEMNDFMAHHTVRRDVLAISDEKKEQL